jgi:putative sigma-54 modulation protein
LTALGGGGYLFVRPVRRSGRAGWLGKERTVQIAISTRHGALGPDQQAYLQEKAEKLVKYFGRLMAIEVAVDHIKHAWDVEIRVSAEHKHDFFASVQAPTAEAAMDQCVHKIEQQLRKYKEQVSIHKGDVARGGTTPASPDLAEPEPE